MSPVTKQSRVIRLWGIKQIVETSAEHRTFSLTTYAAPRKHRGAGPFWQSCRSIQVRRREQICGAGGKCHCRRDDRSRHIRTGLLTWASQHLGGRMPSAVDVKVSVERRLRDPERLVDRRDAGPAFIVDLLRQRTVFAPVLLSVRDGFILG